MKRNSLPHVFSPLEIGGLTIKNRVFLPAHHHMMLDDRAVAYYRERARGGYGLIITVSGTEKMLDRIVKACHKYETRIIQQYYINAGSRERDHDPRDPVHYPSATMPLFKGVMPKEMEVEEIDRSVEEFGAAAKRAWMAGADGFELHMTHDHWPHRWVLSAFNRRQDEYGGELVNRLRYPLRALEEARKQTGEGFVLGVRINGAYETGLFEESRAEAQAVASILTNSGLIDFLDVSGYPVFRGMGDIRGAFIPEAEGIRNHIKKEVPIISTGDRIIDLRMAEDILSAGRVDMVGMVRAGIADPDIVAKSERGDFDDIRYCVGSGQGCLGGFMQGQPMMCTQNPNVGYEAEWGGDSSGALAKRSKQVMVVGAGPAGLQAALTAAQRGHKVILYESSDEAGGQIRFIQKSPRRNDFRQVVDWRLTQLSKLKVPIHLGTQVTANLIRENSPDVVILATGSTPRKATYPGTELPHIYTPSDALLGKLNKKMHVVIIDGVGYSQATDPLEYLVARGIQVTYITSDSVFSSGATMNDWPTMWNSIKDRDNLKIHLNTRIEAITADAVHCVEIINVPVGTHVQNLKGRSIIIKDPDAVVVAIGSDPRDELYKGLSKSSFELHRVGDCLAPRGIEHAVFEGHRVAWGI